MGLFGVRKDRRLDDFDGEVARHGGVISSTRSAFRSASVTFTLIRRSSCGCRDRLPIARCDLPYSTIHGLQSPAVLGSFQEFLRPQDDAVCRVNPYQCLDPADMSVDQ